MPQPVPRLPLALTIGDPSGIGPDIALQLWLRRDELKTPAFYLLADRPQLQARAALLGLDVPIRDVDPCQALQAFGDALPIVRLDNPLTEAPGIPDVANAAGIVEAIDRAVADTLSGRAAAVVTSPIAKQNLYEAGFRYPGHTEYLAHLAERHTGGQVIPVMMLAGPDLRAVPVTIHIPLAQVPGALRTGDIIEIGRILASELTRRFGIARPRIAVSGLNPHAGEGGTMGREDEAIVRPAVAALREAGVEARGPLPADTMFHGRARETYDAALCMYHDQALIPAKALAFDETVNVTLGLPFIRTSPDHGTAFELAGKGVALADSTLAALRLARRMADFESRP